MSPSLLTVALLASYAYLLAAHGRGDRPRAIPVTSPARTLVDLARVVDEDALVRAVREAQFRRLFHIPSM